MTPPTKLRPQRQLPQAVKRSAHTTCGHVTAESLKPYFRTTPTEGVNECVECGELAAISVIPNVAVLPDLRLIATFDLRLAEQQAAYNKTIDYLFAVLPEKLVVAQTFAAERKAELGYAQSLPTARQLFKLKDVGWPSETDLKNLNTQWRKEDPTGYGSGHAITQQAGIRDAQNAFQAAYTKYREAVEEQRRVEAHNKAELAKPEADRKPWTLKRRYVKRLERGFTTPERYHKTSASPRTLLSTQRAVRTGDNTFRLNGLTTLIPTKRGGLKPEALDIALERPFPPGVALSSPTIVDTSKHSGSSPGGRTLAVNLAVYHTIPKPTALTPNSTIVGVDVGVRLAYTTFDGRTAVRHPHANINALKQRRKETYERMKNCRGHKKGASRNFLRLERTISRINTKIAATQDANIKHLAHTIVSQADCIVIEDLNTLQMGYSAKGTPDNPGVNVAAKTGLNRSIRAAKMGMLISELERQCLLQGKHYVEVNARDTSRTCPACGHVDAKNRDKEAFACVECGSSAHADDVGAVNLRNRGLNKLGQSSRVETRDGGSWIVVDKRETSGTPPPVGGSGDGLREVESPDPTESHNLGALQSQTLSTDLKAG